MVLPVTVTLEGATSLSGGAPGLPGVVTSMEPDRTCSRVTGTELPGGVSISATTTVPRMAATAFWVRISTVSPGRIRWRATPMATLPKNSWTVEIPDWSTSSSSESSRTVRRAFFPSSSRANDWAAVLMRSRRKTSSLKRSGCGVDEAA